MIINPVPYHDLNRLKTNIMKNKYKFKKLRCYNYPKRPICIGVDIITI